MTNDPNKKQNDPNQSGQTGQQQQRKNPDDISQKRPSQGGHDVERDEENTRDQDQRKVS